MDNHDAKIYLESVGFPCFYGETLTYIEIANIFKNKGFVKRPSNTQMQIDAPIIRCAGCGCILNDPLCVDCGELLPAHD